MARTRPTWNVAPFADRTTGDSASDAGMVRAPSPADPDVPTQQFMLWSICRPGERSVTRVSVWTRSWRYWPDISSALSAVAGYRASDPAPLQQHRTPLFNRLEHLAAGSSDRGHWASVSAHQQSDFPSERVRPDLAKGIGHTVASRLRHHEAAWQPLRVAAGAPICWLDSAQGYSICQGGSRRHRGCPPQFGENPEPRVAVQTRGGGCAWLANGVPTCLLIS